MNQRARLHVVHTEASLGWGGQEIRILTEARGLIARGHEIELLCPAEARICAEAPNYGVPVTALPIGRKNLRGVIAMRRQLARRRCDVINSHSSTDSWLAAVACAASSPAPPLVRTRHISAAIPDNLATRWLYQRATCSIVTTGQRLREQLVRDNGFDPARIVSVPTGVDTARYHPDPGDRDAARRQLGLPARVPIVGIVATLRSWKGHRYLLDAFAHLPDRATRLVIVGDGPQRAAIEQQIPALGLADRVVLAGNQNDVAPWLRCFDVFALPSYANEGVPQAIVQAMLTALPVVTTDIGSIGEAIQNDSTGLMVAPANATALAAALETLLGDASLRERLGTAARAAALQKFSLDAMLDRMEVVFEAAAAHV